MVQVAIASNELISFYLMVIIFVAFGWSLETLLRLNDLGDVYSIRWMALVVFFEFVPFTSF